jgi:hypothetical protein
MLLGSGLNILERNFDVFTQQLLSRFNFDHCYAVSFRKLDAGGQIQIESHTPRSFFHSFLQIRNDQPFIVLSSKSHTVPIGHSTRRKRSDKSLRTANT